MFFFPLFAGFALGRLWSRNYYW